MCPRCGRTSTCRSGITIPTINLKNISALSEGTYARKASLRPSTTISTLLELDFHFPLGAWPHTPIEECALYTIKLSPQVTIVYKALPIDITTPVDIGASTEHHPSSLHFDILHLCLPLEKSHCTVHRLVI